MSPPRLTQYYPGGTAKQLLDFASALGAGAEPSLSQNALGGPVKQIIDYADPVVTEANPTLDQYAAGGPAGQIVNWMATAEGGGGSGVPEWVPTDAKIYIDLVNDRAWTEDDGEVAINTLLADDPDNGFQGLLAVVSEGEGAVITSSDDDVSAGAKFIGSALASVLAGSTLLLDYEADGSDQVTHLTIELFSPPDFNSDDRIFVFGGTDITLNDAAGSYNAGAYNVSDGANKLAATFSSTKIAVSSNGAVTTSHADPLHPDPITAAAVLFNVNGNEGNPSTLKVRTITVFDPQTDDDLQVLSALTA